MRYLFSLMLFFVFFRSYAQRNKDNVQVWDNTMYATINLKQNIATRTLVIDSSGVLALESLPEKIIINFPDKNTDSVSITFNKDKKTRFTLATNEKGWAQLHLSDFNHGQLELYFHNGELVAIGDRKDFKPKIVTADRPYIKINQLPSKQNEDATVGLKANAQRLQLMLPDIGFTKLEEIKKCILCYHYTGCDSLHPCEISLSNKSAKTEKKSDDTAKAAERPGSVVSGNGTDNIVYLTSQGTAKPKNKRSYRKTGASSRPISILTWNSVNNAQRHYVLYPDGSQAVVNDIDRKQRYNSWIVVKILSPDSTTSKLETNGYVSTKFETTEEQDKALAELGNPQEKSTNTTTTATGSTVKSDSAKVSAVSATEAERNAKTVDKGKTIVTKNKELFSSLYHLSDSILPVAIDLKINKNNSDSAIKKELIESADNKLVVYDKLFNELNLLSKIINSYQDYDREAYNWKAKLIGLDMALEEFNKKFLSVDFRMAEYQAALIDLKQGMKSCLSMTIPDSVDDFKNELVQTISKIDSSYTKELETYAGDVATQYNNAIHRSTTRSVKYLYAQVPDADRFDLVLTTSNPNSEVFKYNFAVKGGFKIDVSSGIFFTGLRNPDFTLSKSNFSFPDTRDSFFVRNNQPVDSQFYTGGVIRDTSGYLIRTNHNKVSFGAGIFAHGYWRSGGPLNGAFTLGFVLNNEGQVYGMAGVSALLANLKNRLVLTVGACGGKVKTISSSVRDNVYQNQYTMYEHGAKLFDNRRQLPKFFDASATTEVPYYMKLKFSWFVALSFNIGSITGSK